MIVKIARRGGGWFYFEGTHVQIESHPRDSDAAGIADYSVLNMSDGNQPKSQFLLIWIGGGVKDVRHQSIAFDTVAYLMSNDGKTIDTYRPEPEPEETRAS